MVATAPRPTTAPVAAPQRATAGSAARELALGYLRYASACWRGDARAAAFPLRLGAYWCAELPPVPATAPDAFSPHGAGGRGIQWYQAEDDVLGYVSGGNGRLSSPGGGRSRVGPLRA